MKKVLFSTIAVALLLVATLIAKTQTENFSATNNYNGSVGTITINDGIAPVYLSIPSMGPYQTTTTAPAINVVINGQTVYAGVGAEVTLPNSDKVDVTWSGPSVIVINPLEND